MQSETTELPIEGRYTLTDRVTTYDLGPVELHNATDRQLERQVAVQLLPATAPEEQKAAFLERQRVAAGIHHCGVVQVYDVGEWHGAHFSVIEKEALSHGGPAPAPDAERALSTGRQVAEALQCVRDAGLETWVFSPAALRRGADGAPRLAVLEGLEHDARYRTAMSSRRAEDGRALGALLGMLIAGLPLGAVPLGVHELVGAPPLTAGEFAAEVAQVELAAQQRTQAYAERRDNAATPYLAAGMLDSHDAPTLAAPVVAQPAIAPSGALAQPYAGPAMVETGRISPAREEQRRAGVPILSVAAAALLLLGLLLFVAWPRTTDPTEVAGSAAFAADSTRTPTPEAAPTAAPTAPPLLAPELVGKPLAEAKEIALVSGLGLIVSSAAHSDQFPVDVVMSQDPAPGTPVASGSDISLVLSLGPEPQPPPPPAGDDGDDDDNKNDKKDNGRGKKKP